MPLPTGQTPKYLYRYCSVERAESLLTQGRVFFPCAMDFNDPFDCGVKMVFNASRLKRERYNRELIRQKAPQMARRFRNRLARKAADRESFEEAEKRFLSRVRRSVGILSMSARRDSLLMWSHYADKHAGLCLEFRRVGDFMVRALPVVYSLDYPELDFFQVEGLVHREDEVGAAAQRRVVERIYLSKSKDWEYEQEWRIVDPVAGRGFQPFPSEVLSGITFGCRTSPDDQRRVREWLGAHSVRLYQAHQNRRSYSLDFTEM